MRKRLRKKRRKGEFSEFGIKLSGKLRPGTDLCAFLDDFICNAIEANGLRFGGGGKDLQLEGYIELGRTDRCVENLERLQRWLAQHGSVEAFRFGDMEDCN